MTLVAEQIEAAATSVGTLCPLCGAASAWLFSKHEIGIRDCQSCGHRFAELASATDKHVERTYGDDYFLNGGAGYSDYLAEQRLLEAHGRRYARLLSKFTQRPGEMLDVGAAAGFLLKGFIEAGWTGCGVEPNDRMASFARETLKLDVRTGTLEDIELDRQFDLVNLIQVMAHFVDPHGAVQRVSELTRTGGLCLVETWDVASWTAKLFGNNWHEYSPPSVLHWYSRRRLESLFAEFGFRAIHFRRPRKFLEVQHGKSLLAHTWQGAFGSIVRGMLKLVPDRLAVPYPFDDVMCLVFQKG